MLTYEPADALGHRLDPRTKLAFQFGFVVAAFAHTTPTGLVVLSAVAAGTLAAVWLSPLSVLREMWMLLPILVLAPAFETIRFGPPWFAFGHAVEPALASYRVLLCVFVGAAYVRSTPVRESRAAIQWLVPGRAGQFLGMGVAFLFRFVPVLQDDLRRARRAQAARLGDSRRASERITLLVLAGLSRTFGRADRFALALRARCFSWNPTLPALRFESADYAVLVLSLALVASAFVGAEIPLV